MPPTTRASTITKVLSTPCSRAMVTMSPLATCATSWPSTASASLALMLRSRPVDTATSALLRLAPVAKALISGASYTATSGMPMPAAWAWRRTVSTSQRSASLRGWVMTWAPVARLAIHLEVSSEISEPPKPNMAPSTSRPAIWSGLTPSSDITMLARNSTARLVARNRAIRLNTLQAPGLFVGDIRQMDAATLEIKPAAPRPCADGARIPGIRRSLPRPLRTLAHRAAARRIAGRRAGQLAAGAGRRWPVAGAHRKRGPPARSARRGRCAAGRAGRVRHGVRPAGGAAERAQRHLSGCARSPAGLGHGLPLFLQPQRAGRGRRYPSPLRHHRAPTASGGAAAGGRWQPCGIRGRPAGTLRPGRGPRGRRLRAAARRRLLGLPAGGGGRRRRTGRHRCGAWRRPAGLHPAPDPAPARARPALPTLPVPAAAVGCRQPQTVQVQRRAARGSGGSGSCTATLLVPARTGPGTITGPEQGRGTTSARDHALRACTASGALALSRSAHYNWPGTV